MQFLSRGWGDPLGGDAWDGVVGGGGLGVVEKTKEPPCLEKKTLRLLQPVCRYFQKFKFRTGCQVEVYGGSRQKKYFFKFRWAGKKGAQWSQGG